MRVRYTLRAQRDLDAIYTYLELRAPAAAQSVKDLIERRIAGLADFPLMAPATDDPGVYELTIIRYPYKVYYEVEDDEVGFSTFGTPHEDFGQAKAISKCSPVLFKRSVVHNATGKLSRRIKAKY